MMANQELSLILSSSEEEEEVVEMGRPTSPEVPLQAKLLWSEGNAAYVYAQFLNIFLDFWSKASSEGVMELRALGEKNRKKKKEKKKQEEEEEKKKVYESQRAQQRIWMKEEKKKQGENNM